MIIKEPEWWDEWTYFDEKNLETKLKDDAPEEVKREWEELQVNEPELDDDTDL